MNKTVRTSAIVFFSILWGVFGFLCGMLGSPVMAIYSLISMGIVALFVYYPEKTN